MAHTSSYLMDQKQSLGSPAATAGKERHRVKDVLKGYGIVKIELLFHKDEEGVCRGVCNPAKLVRKDLRI